MEYKIQKVKLKDVCKIEKGKIGITKAVKGEYPLVVTAEERLSHNEWHFNEPATIVPLVSSTGHGHASIKRLHYADGKYAVGNILATLIPIDHDYLNAKYLYVYLTINKEELLVSQMTGAANVSLTLTRLADVEIEIPDYTTQLKVIKRYEDSESYKNQMGAQIEVRSQLIENLRQQILQDAITGKLSEKWRKENPDVDSAEILLGKIKAEKEKLIKEGKIRKQKSLPPISEEEIPFELPNGWVWCRLGEIIEYSENLDIHRYLPQSSIVNYIDIDSIDNVNQTIREVKQRSVNELSTRARRVLKKGYILYSTVRPYLKNIAVIDQELENFIGSTGFNVFRPLQINLMYIFNYLLTSYVNETFKALMVGFNSPSITNEQFEKVLLPLPPLAEQQYIVERIESLFIKIDRINQINNENLTMVDLLNKVSLKELFGN